MTQRDEIDFERVVFDPEYRRGVMRRLNRAAAQTKAPAARGKRPRSTQQEGPVPPRAPRG